jgi:predicted transcriptional regulator
MYVHAKFSTRVAYLPEITDRQMEEFRSTPVRSIHSISRRNLWVELKRDTPMNQLVRYLAERNIHRVVIIEEARYVSLITQSRFTAFLYRNALLFEVAFRLVQDCVRVTKVVSVRENEMVIKAFDKMTEAEVSGVAVVGPDGKLVGTLSARDLKVTDDIYIT